MSQDQSANAQMRLDRFTNPDGRGKYAVLNLRKLKELVKNNPEAWSGVPDVVEALTKLENAGLLSYGTKPGEEFFVLKLRDKFAAPAISAYATEVFKETRSVKYSEAELNGLMNYHADICDLFHKSKKMGCKLPD